jgi:ABC-type amino acid transport system permease subunit
MATTRVEVADDIADALTANVSEPHIVETYLARRGGEVAADPAAREALLFPLMLPAGADIDKLLRAQVAITLFVAANMAEIVRAGLQSVPRAQADAAGALGFTWWAGMRLIILPQALRSVISSFVNLGIGIFLDTTLVTIIGLFDFLNAARVSATTRNGSASITRPSLLRR